MSLASLILLAAPLHGSGEEPMTLFDFDAADAANWTTIHDTVMGGRSAGRIARTEDGTLRFWGNLSLENNGGFTSFRSRSVDFELDDTAGIELRVKGDGRTYIFSTERSDIALFGGGYWQEFATEKDRWTTVRLPWDAFVPTSFGEVVEAAPSFDASKLSSMGVYLYDKQEGPFDLEIDSIAAYWPGSAPLQTGPAFPEDFGTVIGLLTTLGLDQALVDLDGEFTLFAPTDQAFQELPDGLFMELAKPENAELLKSILLYHGMPGRYPAARALTLVNSSSLEGSTLDFTKFDGGLQVEQAEVIATDLEFAGGVVHAIDKVLVPPAVAIKLSDVPTDAAAPIAGVSTVFALVEAAGLSEALADKERYTLFAPTDEAFAALPRETVEALLRPENIDALRAVLLNHVVDGGVTAFTALRLAQSVPVGDSVPVEPLGGKALALASKGGELTIGGAVIERTDILLGNAVVHVVDQVLVPEGLTLAETDAIAAFLDEVVRRGVASFNAGDTAACAEGYRTALEALLLLGSLEDAALESRVRRALDEAEHEGSRAAAWTLREAIDAVRLSR